VERQAQAAGNDYYDDVKVSQRESVVYDETRATPKTSVHDDTLTEPRRSQVHSNEADKSQQPSHAGPRNSSIDDILATEAAKNFQPHLANVDSTTTYVIPRPKLSIV
jgi:hypothetical protein